MMTDFTNHVQIIIYILDNKTACLNNFKIQNPKIQFNWRSMYKLQMYKQLLISDSIQQQKKNAHDQKYAHFVLDSFKVNVSQI